MSGTETSFVDTDERPSNSVLLPSRASGGNVFDSEQGSDQDIMRCTTAPRRISSAWSSGKQLQAATWSVCTAAGSMWRRNWPGRI